MRKSYAGLLAVMVTVGACSSTAATASVTAAPGGTSATTEATTTAPATTDATTTSATAAGGDVSGTITVLTQRTDLVDNVFKDYAAKFHAKYPNANVKFEAITDYEGEVRTRMNTEDYGDVLLIPNSISADQLPTYFEPLGSVADLGAKYRFVTEQAFQDKVYGLAITGNAQGILYNKKVWKAAGVTADPKTPDEFIADLQAIKDKEPGVVPLYTNYKDGWPTTQWGGNRGEVTADPDMVNKLATDDAPWAAGKDYNVIDKLLFDVVNKGLTEKDPTTTNWENSKGLIGGGKVGTMVLGSWAITQMQDAAVKAKGSKDDIGYMPFPVQTGGQFHSVIGGDYKQAINIHSKFKAADRAWIDWFTDESNYATDQGGIAPLKTLPAPATLADFTKDNVQYVELKPAPAGQEGLVQKIDKQSEIGITDPPMAQRIIDAARGAKKETLDQIFADYNKKWAAARKTVGTG